MNDLIPISVLTTVYNGERFVARAIESILNQTFSQFEYIIIDDGSVDNTWNILSTFNDPRIRLFRNPNNLGRTCSLAKGVDLACGEFLAIMDADDFSLPERLEKEILVFRENPEVVVVGTQMRQFSETGRYLGEYSLLPLTHAEIRWGLFWGTPLAQGTVMMRLSSLRECGGYDVSFVHSEDTELWTRISLIGKCINLPTSLYYRYKVSGSMCDRFNSEQLYANALVFQRLFAQYGLHFSLTSFRSYVKLLHTNHPLEKGEFFAAARILKKVHVVLRNCSLAPSIQNRLEADFVHRIVGFSRLRLFSENGWFLLLWAFRIHPWIVFFRFYQTLHRLFGDFSRNAR